MAAAPDRPEYVASVHGATVDGRPCYRVVTDGLQVLYVTVPYKRSDAVTVDETIRHAITALRTPPKPVR